MTKYEILAIVSLCTGACMLLSIIGWFLGAGTDIGRAVADWLYLSAATSVVVIIWTLLDNRKKNRNQKDNNNNNNS